MIKLALPLAHTVIGYIKRPDGAEVVMVRREYSTDTKYVVYAIDPSTDINAARGCYCGDYCDSYVEALMRLTIRAGST